VAHSPKLIYTAQSKNYFYCRDTVTQYVLETGHIPLNPFRMFDYFLNDRVPRDIIRNANNAVIARADELWVFGTEIANGVMQEMLLAQKLGKPIRYHTIGSTLSEIQPTTLDSLAFEPELAATIAGEYTSPLAMLQA
jgi:hypothetical protein